MNWFDKFLSRATVLLVLGAIVVVVALPALLQIAVVGTFLPGSWDFSQHPLWRQVLLGFLIAFYLVLETCLLFGVGKKRKKESADPSPCLVPVGHSARSREIKKTPGEAEARRRVNGLRQN